MEFIYHPIFLKHDTGPHPENAGRLDSILRVFRQEKIDVLKPESGERYINLAHDPEYIERVRDVSEMGGGFLDMETPISKKTYEAASYAVGAAIKASEVGGFALVRPPGHHATRNRGMGFCVFNNVAIAALKLAKKGKKVLILDIDIHHGNGTQDIVLGKENILFFSIHQNPLYPGTGLFSEENCLNFPMPPGTGDKEYTKVLEKELVRSLSEFEPDVVGVSVGFDAYFKDAGLVAGNSFHLTQKTYFKIKELLTDYKTFYVLEGGYNPRSIVEGIEALTTIPK